MTEDKLKDLHASFDGTIGAYVGGIVPADQYDDSFCEVLLTAMRHGLDRKGAAGAIGISYKTFERWLADYPKFAEAAEVGDTLCQTFWQMQGIKNLTFSPTGRQINSKLYQLFMQNLCGWGDQKSEDKSKARGVLAFTLTAEPPAHVKDE